MDGNEKTPLAVCEMTLTEELLREGYETLFSRIFRRKRLFIAAVPLVVAIGAVALVRHNTVLALIAVILAAYGIGRLCLISCAKKAVGKSVETSKSLCEKPMRLEFSEDSFLVRSDQAAAAYRYSDVIKAAETEHLWLLYLGEKENSQVLFIPKPAAADGQDCGRFLDRILGDLDKKAVKRLI